MKRTPENLALIRAANRMFYRIYQRKRNEAMIAERDRMFDKEIRKQNKQKNEKAVCD